MAKKTRLARTTGEKGTGEKETKQLALRLLWDLNTRLELKYVQEGRGMEDLLNDLIKKFIGPYRPTLRESCKVH